MTNIRTQIETIIVENFGSYLSKVNKEATDQILSVVSQHYVTKEKVTESVKKLRRCIPNEIEFQLPDSGYTSDDIRYVEYAKEQAQKAYNQCREQMQQCLARLPDNK
ncbi:MAG: hypothetical protein DDT19_01130 [Syntrophomonadaceae bacterium]|nr:hypothetical protein [Bacillota bacterium]